MDKNQNIPLFRQEVRKETTNLETYQLATRPVANSIIISICSALVLVLVLFSILIPIPQTQVVNAKLVSLRGGIDIRALSSGLLHKLDVKIGQIVNKGDILAVINEHKDIGKLGDKADTLKKSFENEGDALSKNINLAIANRKHLEDKLSTNIQALDTQIKLYNNKVITVKKQIKSQKKFVDILRTSYKDKLIMINELLQNEMLLLELEKSLIDVEISKNNLVSEKSKLQNEYFVKKIEIEEKLTQISLMEASLKQREVVTLESSNTNIIAPRTATVAAIDHKEFQPVVVGDRLFHLIPSGEAFELVFELSSLDAAGIKKGMPLFFNFSSIVDPRKQKFNAIVSEVSLAPKINSKESIFKFRAEIQDKKRDLEKLIGQASGLEVIAHIPRTKKTLFETMFYANRVN